MKIKIPKYRINKMTTKDISFLLKRKNSLHSETIRDLKAALKSRPWTPWS